MDSDEFFVDSLALLSTKVASNVFDLSSRMHHVSIRDQMVRSQIVVRDLINLHSSKSGNPPLNALLIVGAGIAGVCAALEAINRNVDEVVVVEVEESPFHLLHDVDCRHVGPFMYEWPSTFCQDQSYPHHEVTPWSKSVAAAPLQWTAKKPVSAHKLAELLKDDLRSRLNKPPCDKWKNIKIFVCVSKEKATEFVKKFVATEILRANSLREGNPQASPEVFEWEGREWLGENNAKCKISPAYVLLAAGMGSEDTTLIKQTSKGDKNYFCGLSFWAKENDDLLSAETANRKVAIFGGGDGALQDALRALTGCEHPLQFMAFLEKASAVREALARVMPRLLDADRQSRQFGTWTVKRHEYCTLDETCREFARELARNNRVVRRVGQGLRQGSGEVSLFVRDNHFDKAYLLNRFIVHLIEACRGMQKSMWSGRMQLHVRRNRCAVDYCEAADDRHVVTIAIPNKDDKEKGLATFDHYYHCDKIAVRYGILPDSIPGSQMIQISDRPSPQRTSLSRVELPFVAEKDRT